MTLLPTGGGDDSSAAGFNPTVSCGVDHTLQAPHCSIRPLQPLQYATPRYPVAQFTPCRHLSAALTTATTAVFKHQAVRASGLMLASHRTGGGIEGNRRMECYTKGQQRVNVGCARVWVCVHLCVCACVWVCVHLCVCVCMPACACVCVYVPACGCICVRICVPASVHVFVCACV